MENEQIKKKILADYKTLLGLKYDSPDLVKEKLRIIGERIGQLDRSTSEENDVLDEAHRLINSALSTDYLAFAEALTEEDKEEALAQVKHKAAEACQRLQIHA
ncbi:MAG: hypothetical protein EOO39_43935 [Cytophagaceae bacterium]|nr:MAG: hypothetical protein EOO39_43935 [Cytophagaceae bacterium]